MKRHYLPAIWLQVLYVLTFAMAVCFISTALTLKCNATPPPDGETEAWHACFFYCIIAICATFIFVTLICFFSHIAHRETRLVSYLKKHTVYTFFGLIALIATITIAIHACAIHGHALENPGGVFAVIMGVATLFGTFLAYKSIRESQGIIKSYSQFYEQLELFLNEIESGSNGIMYISCRYILPGWLQVTNKQQKDRVYELFQKVLINKIGDVRVVTTSRESHLNDLTEIACYNVPAMKQMSSEKERAGYIFTYIQSCYHLIELCNNRCCLTLTNKEVKPVVEWNGTDKGEMIRILHDKIGHNRGKAEKIRADRPQVKTLGFSTTDHDIIEYVKEQIEEIKNKEEISPYFLYASEHRAIVVIPSGLQQLISNSTLMERNEI